MAGEVHVGMEEVIAHFSALEDPRSEINRRHPLVSVVVITIMAVLAGASGPTGIAKWAKFKEDLLLKNLPLPHGIPRKDVFRRVLATLTPAAFQECFVSWLTSLRNAAAAAQGIDSPVLSVDGKTLRRSHDEKKGLSALHLVSVWASEFGLSLGQVATDQKSNEITAIPELLKLVDLRGAIITIDAMGTQKAIAREIVDAGADYVLALKANQEKLHDAVIKYIDEQIENEFQNVDASQHVTEEKGHGRKERRHYLQMPAPKSLPGVSLWQGIATIGVATLICLRNGEETVDCRYFISSLKMGVKQFAHAVRSHWAIENTCHWTLDMTYREDESRVRDKQLRENLAWINRFTLSLLKQHPSKDTVAMKRRSCGWNDEFLLQTITGVRV